MGKVSELAAFLALSAAILATVAAFFRLRRERAEPAAWVLPSLLAVLCVDGVLAWPAGAHPARFPLTALRLAFPVVCVVLWKIDRGPAAKPARLLLSAALALGLLLAAQLAFRSLIALRPAFMG